MEENAIDAGAVSGVGGNDGGKEERAYSKAKANCGGVLGGVEEGVWKDRVGRDRGIIAVDGRYSDRGSDRRKGRHDWRSRDMMGSLRIRFNGILC